MDKEIFLNIFNFLRNKKNPLERADSNAEIEHDPIDSEETIKRYIDSFRKKISEIPYENDAFKKIEGEEREELSKVEFYHGTKSNLASLKEKGFKGSRFKFINSPHPLYYQIAGSFVFFTRDHKYALDYAVGQTDNVAKIKLPTNINIYEIDFRKIKESVFPKIIDITKNILEEIALEKYSNQDLIDYANLSFNLYLLHHGVEAINSRDQIAFVGTSNIPPILN